METGQIDIYELSSLSFLTPVRCADFSEAAAVCLDYHKHAQSVDVEITGDLEAKFQLTWKEVTQQMRDSREDMQLTVEAGAYCMAMLVVQKLTNLKVVKQSQKGTGFDFWLADQESEGFKISARLEVSGILKGTTTQIKQRMKEKMEQTKKSDTMKLPAYIVIVEFSQPHLKIIKR